MTRALPGARALPWVHIHTGKLIDLFMNCSDCIPTSPYKFIPHLTHQSNVWPDRPIKSPVWSVCHTILFHHKVATWQSTQATVSRKCIFAFFLLHAMHAPLIITVCSPVISSQEKQAYAFCAHKCILVGCQPAFIPS